ncbi:hypothetical protein LI951_05305 [Enterococcus sp. BWT-B8]|uniref:hypothetical protein n=1 Tax=unclassified Enterococcus TaxID=2608891 RepID=UPI001E4314D5|nr:MULTISPECIES: hypothetical protein [unclassified Enterococcus]MCB5951475.1 hypothetical protein [Enterococcus sp. BWT-B8]MCB5955034.1 hypothetical protein [Enterococcus sp. CWB-B31]
MTNAGSWTIPETPMVSNEVKEILEEATSSIRGSIFEPFALIGTQVVAGVKYKILCKVTLVAPNSEPKLSIVTIYKPLDGKAELEEMTDI